MGNVSSCTQVEGRPRPPESDPYSHDSAHVTCRDFLKFVRDAARPEVARHRDFEASSDTATQCGLKSRRILKSTVRM